MELMKYNGKHYGVTSGAEPMVVFYNKTMFENNGIKTPTEYYKEGKWDWNALKEVGIKLTQDTDKDGTIDQWGFMTWEPLITFLITNDTDLLKKGEKGQIEREVKIDNSINAPVKAGQKIGEVIYTISGNEVGRTELVASSSVQRASFMRIFVNMVQGWFGMGRTAG
jgi:ABC-type glycerol-3-phosphate transport system substrate-binding protein